MGAITLIKLLLVVGAAICFGMAASSRPTRGWNAEPAGLLLLTLLLLLYLFAF